MNRTRNFVAFLLVAFLMISNPVFATPGLEPTSLSASFVPQYNWFFETNQAAQTSPYDHRLLVVGSAGDVNGDGYEDVLVGKRDFDLPSYTDAGRAWLFYGSASGLSSTPGRIFDPPYLNTYGFFGTQVGTAGDVNNDGYDDVIIGMDNYDNAYSDEGAVFVWYGSATGPKTTYDWMARGNNTYAHFGFTLDSAGDVNGDNYDDIIVGAYRYDDNNVSHAYVWLGGSGGLGANGTPANADWYASDPYPGQATGISFGRLVRGIGDVNGDGFTDVLVGASTYDGSVMNQGAVFVWYGSDTGLGPTGTLGNADWMAVSGQTDSRFGMFGADGVGDLNNDGYADLAVGAYAFDNPEVNEGLILVWYGTASGLGVNGDPTNADWRAEANVSSNLGFTVRPAGDANGDGFADLLVTAPSYPVPSLAGALTAGAWFVWLGSYSGLGDNGTPTNADLSGFGDQQGGGLGRDDACAADVNNDGISDLFLASWAYDHPESDEGIVLGYDNLFKNFMPFIRQENP